MYIINSASLEINNNLEEKNSELLYILKLTKKNLLKN